MEKLVGFLFIKLKIFIDILIIRDIISTIIFLKECMMVRLGFAFNFNIQRCEIEVGEEKQIIEIGYKPLVKLFIKYGLKADLFISGFSSKLIQEINPQFLSELHEHIGKEFQLGTYTYTHPIPQLLIPKEFSMQMEKGMALDRAIHHVETEGFLPPEFAYSQEMGEVLHEQGVTWFVALASQIQKGLRAAGVDQDPYFPCKVDIGDGRTLIAVPAAYQLPDTPSRFFKLMMKGLLPVDTVIAGIEKFALAHPDGVLLFKRDAETIFIDHFNSGFNGTFEVMEEFLSKAVQLDCVQPIWIEETVLALKNPTTITLPDYLGNTKIETFTEGAAQSIWDMTQKVRDKILEAEKNGVSSELVEKAWHHLMLSHNSDGRIGYWFSEWNPGEHTVAPTRRQFVEDNLQAALKILG